MVVFSRDTDGTTYWYAPRRETDVAVPLEADQVGRPLDWSTRLGVKHHEGRYQLQVLFFDRPVSAADAAEGRAHPVQSLRLQLEVRP